MKITRQIKNILDLAKEQEEAGFIIGAESCYNLALSVAEEENESDTIQVISEYLEFCENHNRPLSELVLKQQLRTRVLAIISNSPNNI